MHNRQHLLFQLYLHNAAGLVRMSLSDHQIAPLNIVFALHDLPNGAGVVDDRRARRIGHEGGERLQAPLAAPLVCQR